MSGHGIGDIGISIYIPKGIGINANDSRWDFKRRNINPSDIAIINKSLCDEATVFFHACNYSGKDGDLIAWANLLNRRVCSPRFGNCDAPFAVLPTDDYPNPEWQCASPGDKSTTTVNPANETGPIR